MDKLRITYLYPHHMNLYGDTGNIICLKKRCEWRGIEVSIKMVNPGDSLQEDETDLYFFGGGQDAQQEYVSKDLQRHKDTIASDIESGTVALTICGGYQLFGHRFITKDEHIIPGIGIFDVETRGSDHRMIGNIIIEVEHSLHDEIESIYPDSQTTLVGFENHSGETTILNGKPIGNTRVGYGNDYTSKQEGYRYKNAFGTYMHGSLLPKNPHFADLLITKALLKRDSDFKLKALDDKLEYQAHLNRI